MIPKDPKQTWFELEELRIRERGRAWANAVCAALLASLLLAMAGCFVSRVAAQGILAKPKPPQPDAAVTDPGDIKLQFKKAAAVKTRTDRGTLNADRVGKNPEFWNWTIDTGDEVYRLAFDDKREGDKKKKPDLTQWAIAEKLIGRNVVVTSLDKVIELGAHKYLLVTAIMAAPPEPQAKPAVVPPVSEPKLTGAVATLRALEQPRVDLPAWVFPRLDIPEWQGKHVPAKDEPPALDPRTSILFRFVPPAGWETAEYWAAWTGNVGNGDTAGIPAFFPGHSWVKLGQAPEWRTPDGYPPGRQGSYLLAVSNPATGAWKTLKLMATVGNERTADFRRSTLYSILTEMVR